MNKITEQDLANRGVKGLPDVPGLTTEEMQRKLEEIAREILIPKVNELVEGLNNANSNLNNYYHKNIQIATPMELAQTPSTAAYSLAPICINADGSSDKRAGIGFHNQGVVGGYFYLDTDGALYLILSSGVKFKINMTQVD